MKTIHYTIGILVLALFTLGCKTEVNISPTEEAQNELIEALQGSWTVVEVRKDNSVLSDFENFSLTITDKGYTTSNGAPVWPSSGSFDFESVETDKNFIRQDGRLFTATVNNGLLTIVIVYQEETARGIFGTYEFVLE